MTGGEGTMGPNAVYAQSRQPEQHSIEASNGKADWVKQANYAVRPMFRLSTIPDADYGVHIYSPESRGNPAGSTSARQGRLTRADVYRGQD